MSAPVESIVDPSEVETPGRWPNSILNEFFAQNEPAFRKLSAIREKVNSNLIFAKQGRLSN